MALSIVFDHAQTRVLDDRITVNVGGEEMDADGLSSGVWIDPITKTLMLTPNVKKASWYVLDTGDYAKLGISDFGLSGTDWENRADQHAKGPWICRKDASTNGAAITTSTYAKNRGFWISWFSYGSGDVFLQLRCGWNSSATIAGGVGVEVYSDGTVLVYKSGDLVGSGKISPGNAAGTKSNTVMEMMLLPFRHRELLVYGNGDGFTVLFEDIDEDDADPTITGATNWWWEIVDGGTQVQTAPLVFNTAGGTAYSVKTSFVEPPATGEDEEEFSNDSSWLTSPAVYKIYGHPAYGSGTQTAVSSLVEWDTTAFTPDGTTDQVRIKTVLSTSNAGYTPFIYGAQMGFEGERADTDDSEEFDATGETVAFDMSVPDSASGVRGRIILRDPVALESDIAALRTQCSRPIAVKLGTQFLIDGIGDAPDYDDGPNELAERCMIEIADRWQAMEQYIFRETIPLDGVNLSSVLRFLGRMGGFPLTDTAVSTSTFDIPFQPSRICGEWGTLIEPGDSAADWFSRLIDTYAGNWIYGVRPKTGGVELYAQSPTDLGTTAAKTLYRTKADAIAGGVASNVADLAVYRSFMATGLEPIANDISVTGLNPRTGRPIRSHKADAASKNPVTAPSSRPTNWLGFTRPYGLVTPEITTQAACDFACELLYDRFTPIGKIAEWECTLLANGSNVPLWRGANVRLVGEGVYQIRSFEFGASVEVSSSAFWRECRYTGIKVANEP